MKFLKYFFIFFLNVNFVFAGSKISLIRDAEIENFLYEISKPIFRSANLNPNDIKFYIVDDNSINAFVMGGQNIFVNTGTLTSFDTPDAVLGILAHETGHISAGHLARNASELSSVQSIGLGSILLGIGAMIAGAPELGQAIIFGGMQVQQQSVLKYTRVQEESADSLAIKYLNDNNYSSSALLKSMNKFYMNELQYSNELEYYSTHPLSRNRKQFVENKLKNEKNINDNFNQKYQEKFNFIKSKILAYQTGKNKNYINNSKSTTDDGRYFDAIINMNNNNTKQALNDIDYLIKKYQNNPYFYELKGDIYLKENNVNEALKNYNISDKLLKNNILIKKMIAFIIVKYHQQNLYQKAIDNLNYVIQVENDDNASLKLLAEAYFLNNEKAMSYLTLAKYYIGINDDKKATKYLEMAKKETDDKNILEKINDIQIGYNKEDTQ